MYAIGQNVIVELPKVFESVSKIANIFPNFLKGIVISVGDDIESERLVKGKIVFISSETIIGHVGGANRKFAPPDFMILSENTEKYLIVLNYKQIVAVED